MRIMENDNPCPKCKIGEIYIYTKRDGNIFSCNNCNYTLDMEYSAK